MKKLLIITLLIACILSLCACNNSTETTKIYNKPPALTVKCGSEQVTALLGTHIWNWTDSDGRGQGVASDHAHPLNAQEHVPVLNTSEKNAVLEFEDTPDSVSVVCWSDEHWNDIYAAEEEIIISNNSFELKQGGYIYQVKANWNDKTKHNGDATYSFCVVKE